MSAPFQKTLGPVTLGEINLAANLAVGVSLPALLAQIDLMIGFIGGFKATFSAQFNAAINFSASFTNPALQISLAITAALQVVAGLQAALSAGLVLPTVSAQLSASLSIAAAAQVQIGLINAAIDIALGVTTAGAGFLAELSGSLTAGGGSVVAYGWDGINAADLQSELASYPFAVDGFTPLTPVSGVMLLTGSPAAYTGMKFLFVTP